MNAEFWEVASPFLKLSAREIAYGDQNRLTAFEAIAIKVGHPVSEKGCLICVKDSLISLKNAHKQYTLMAKKIKPASYTLLRDLFYKGNRITTENLTDALAKEILSAKPHLAQYFKAVVVADVPEVPAVEAVEEIAESDE
jgi:hypothetical protein